MFRRKHFELWAAIILIVYFGILGDSTPSNTNNTQNKELSGENLVVGVRKMADSMVKDDNKIGLRMWAKSLGQSAPKFASAESLLATIRQGSNDFAIYRDKAKVLELARVLSDQDMLFLEVLKAH